MSNKQLQEAASSLLTGTAALATNLSGVPPVSAPAPTPVSPPASAPTPVSPHVPAVSPLQPRSQMQAQTQSLIRDIADKIQHIQPLIAEIKTLNSQIQPINATIDAAYRRAEADFRALSGLHAQLQMGQGDATAIYTEAISKFSAILTDIQVAKNKVVEIYNQSARDLPSVPTNAPTPARRNTGINPVLKRKYVGTAFVAWAAAAAAAATASSLALENAAAEPIAQEVRRYARIAFEARTRTEIATTMTEIAANANAAKEAADRALALVREIEALPRPAPGVIDERASLIPPTPITTSSSPISSSLAPSALTPSSPPGSPIQMSVTSSPNTLSSLGRLKRFAGATRQAMTPAPTPPALSTYVPGAANERPQIPAPIQTLLRSLELPTPLAAPAASAPAPESVQNITGIFVLDVSGNLLIHQRGSTGTYAHKLGVPMGTVPPQVQHVTQAIQELREEALPMPAPISADLTPFYTSANGIFYVWHAPAGLEIEGPAAGFEDEVVFPFPRIRGLAIADDSLLSYGYAWVSVAALLRFLQSPTGALYSTSFLTEALSALQQFLSTGESVTSGQPIPTEPMQSGEVPTWASGYFTDADLAAVRAKCADSNFIGPECGGRAIYRDILVADEFKKTGRLAVHPDRGVAAYNALVDEITALKADGTNPDRLATLQYQLEKDYGDMPLWIADGETGVPRVLPLPNPYRAMAERESGVSFANPAGTPQRQKNVDVLRSLVGPKGREMLEDSKFATSLLEALWFCGQSHVMSDKARCYPARILAELREMEGAGVQKSVWELASGLRWSLVTQWGQQVVDEFKGVRGIQGDAVRAPISAAAPPSVSVSASASVSEGSGAGGVSGRAEGEVTHGPAREKPAPVEERSGAPRYGVRRGVPADTT